MRENKVCLICVELTKNKLTSKEARNNLKEMYKSLEKDHILELLTKIYEKEDEENGYYLSHLEDIHD